MRPFHEDIVEVQYNDTTYLILVRDSLLEKLTTALHKSKLLKHLHMYSTTSFGYPVVGNLMGLEVRYSEFRYVRFDDLTTARCVCASIVQLVLALSPFMETDNGTT